MTQAKHTPGPWKVAANNAVKAGNKNICSHVNAASRDVVNMGVDLEIAKANARLIATAPKMYELLAMRAESGDNDAAKLLQEIDDV